MKQIPFYSTKLDGSFWGEKQRVSRDVTVDAVYDRFRETHRFDALKCDIESQKREGWKPHIFWDSDAAKWIEGAAYVLERGRNPELEEKIDALISDMCASQLENGYYNCYFNVYDTDKKFRIRTDHELYCLGHIIEAAIAYYHATGKDRLLGLAEKYTDLVIKVFTEEKSAAFETPGHEEIELALVRLYRLTGKKKYLDLSLHFINARGRNSKDPGGYYPSVNALNAQDHLPVREQRTAEGHAVRAMYLYMGMADLALETGDEELFRACDAVFDNVSGKRMYITGGIGSSSLGEAFTVDYDLPNEKAYAETCASLALALFCRRMSAIRPDRKYGDVAERAMYNGSISGISVSGDEFFYENPLSVDLRNRVKNASTKDKERYPAAQRVKVFDCSCCPPNILRFINSIADFLYTEDDEGTLYVHHYMNGTTEQGGKHVRQITDYPSDGRVVIEADGYGTVAVRVPSWCDSFTASAEYVMKDGYAYFTNSGRIEIDFAVRPKYVFAAPQVHECAGKTAVAYGPVVYCVEGTDNDGDIFALRADISSGFDIEHDSRFGLPVLKSRGYTAVGDGELYFTADRQKFAETTIKFIPYCGMENRGRTDMAVWIPVK